MTVERNLVANFAGKFWTAFISLAFVPVYIRYMGMEAYGLVGFHATLQAALSLFDLGCSTTLNRETARRSSLPGQEDEMRDLLMTMQGVYWGGALLVAAGVALAAPWIARHWVNARGLSVPAVESAVTWMGAVIALQMVYGFYSGGLLGLQRQVPLNLLNGVVSAFRAAGAVAVLHWISPSVQAFFAWQAASGLLGACSISAALWRVMPSGSRRARLRKSLLAPTWRFMAGMSATSVVGLLLTQTDKVILSRLLSLEAFGYYSLAGMIASSLHYLGNPVYTAFFPSFTQRYGAGDQAGLGSQYHKATQVLAVLVLPVAGVMVFFPREAILAWTMQPALADAVGTLVALLGAGTALNLLASIPYGLQLAHGRTRLGLVVNGLAALVLLPALPLAVRRFGILGAGGVWVALNAGYVLVYVQVMHRTILPGEQWRWYFGDVAPPLAAVVATAAAVKMLNPGVPTDSRGILLLCLGGAWLLMLAAAAGAAPGVRAALREACARAGKRPAAVKA